MNLLEALTRIENEANDAVKQGATAEEVAARVVDVAIGVWSEDKERNKRIGDNGAAWILEKLEREGTIAKGDKIAVLTVCNTGSLATSVRCFPLSGCRGIAC